MAVLSNKPVNPSRAIVEALGLGKFFSLVYGGNSFATKKPDPEGAQTILRETEAGPQANPDRGRLRGGRPHRPQCRHWTCGVTYGFAPHTLHDAAAGRGAR